MKAAAAIILVVVSIAAAESPYPASGWKPSGPAFRLPQRSQQSQAPPTQYGAPPQEYGPPAENEPTTTEVPTTTEASTERQAENLVAKPQKLQSANAAEPSRVYVVVPQAQKLLYRVAAPAFAAAEKLVQQPSAVPVQAVPALARIQSGEAPVLFEQYPQVVQYQQLQVLPSVQAYSSSLSQSSVFTPHSSSFVQIYQ